MSLWKRFLFSFSSTRFGAGLMKVSFAHIDPIIFKASKGRLTGIGPTIIPHLLLTTIGCKSGKKREAQLVYTDIDGVAHIVASNFGGHNHPAWSHNLAADPMASMLIIDSPVSVRAERLSDDERDGVWHRLAANIPNYDVYKTRTDRNLKVYRLIPCG